MTKRACSPDAPRRRVKPTPVDSNKFRVTNLDDGETVHQTCVLINGESPPQQNEDNTSFASVLSTDQVSSHVPHAQTWPVAVHGGWKALVMLSPGVNTLIIKLHHAGGISDTIQISVTYQPLLQLPPLHLAVLVAKDSPLLMDCPPAKFGGISTAHSSIDAAIAKFRVAAYMWQALTAEDMRQKGFGRRSFRLDEEWTPNTTLQKTHQSVHNVPASSMGCVARVHLVRSEKTVAQLRDANVAQQNSRAHSRDALHKYFESALKSHGAPFDTSCQPVVAGMILDSHYDAESALILGHAALGCHKPNGISLGVFGSHLTYSWPRFMEEIPACLTDDTPTGDMVGNDNGECNTMRGACFVGQGAFLHEVGHAFGAQHTTGIMARGYSKHWGRNFLADTGNENEARWDLRDVLKFKLLPHFRLPGEQQLVTADFRAAHITIEGTPDVDDAGDNVQNSTIKISCTAGLAQVTTTHGDDNKTFDFTTDKANNTPKEWLFNNIHEQYNPQQPLRIEVLAMNGKERVVDAWKLLKQKATQSMRIPHSSIVLHKQSARSDGLDENDDEENFIPWAFLLRERGSDGNLYRATSIDLRVGCTMDGARVYFADGHYANCGPMMMHGARHEFGGHASERRDVPEGVRVAKVELATESQGWGSLAGIRMTLSNGVVWGELNADGDNQEAVVTLQPGHGDVVVGFYGQSDRHSGFTYEFGILTAPEGVELPDQAYTMPELKNP
ncbi:hypothetical protein PISL3812_00729 [Talaromyces islandicus]|uniref:Zinc metalloproteinase YIL108W n=1 Tax=Talaromyces islandicus TaxID=28573 RepID=A0A0U1LK49_TALIS|nr:hypothetical protein PISL3812_00729 [Talaromyces islandicus]